MTYILSHWKRRNSRPSMLHRTSYISLFRPPVINRRRFINWLKAFAADSRFRRCWACPARAKPTRWPTSSRSWGGLRWCLRPTKRLRRSCTPSFASSFRAMRSSTLFRITTTTSRKPMCRSAIYLLKRIRRSMRISSRCACPQPKACWSGAIRLSWRVCRRFTALAIRPNITAWCSRCARAMPYTRNETDFQRGTFRVRGDMIDIFPAEHAEMGLRVDLFDDQVNALHLFDPLTGQIRRAIARFTVYPSSHYVTPRDTVLRAVETIKAELRERLEFFQREAKLVEAQRLEQRTRFDLEMLQELGFCKGIEHYSRHLSGAAPGEPPPTLIDYLPSNALMFLDESHVLIGQLNGMYNGDRARKENLVEYGFRLPCALDNRPLTFDEFERRMRQTVFVSATPAEYERRASGQTVEQVVRPTGRVDPALEVRPAITQVDDVLAEIRARAAASERTLVTVLTKKLAEQLTEFLSEQGVKVRYLHSDIDAIERVEIIRDLRLGLFDVLVGINLMREGLDIPEVSLVAILDADKEGFLRSERSLIQTIGRAAR